MTSISYDWLTGIVYISRYDVMLQTNILDAAVPIAFLLSYESVLKECLHFIMHKDSVVHLSGRL